MLIGGREAGRVTSGGPAPFLKKNIGMAYVPPQSSVIGTDIEISIRGQRRGAPSFRCGFTSDRINASASKQRGPMYPTDYRYTKQHEWVKVQGDVATIGITDYAQQELGDVVFVEMPKVGARAKSRLVLRLG